MKEDFLECIAALAIGLLFTFMLTYGAISEDELVNKNCNGLSGYEYGQCQAHIYGGH